MHRIADDSRRKRSRGSELGSRRVLPVEIVLHADGRIETPSGLVDSRVDDGGVVDRSAAGDGGRSGQHPNYLRIGQADANGLVEREVFRRGVGLRL